MSTDRISNLISSLKNATMTGKSCIETDFFKQGKEVLEVLKSKDLIKELKIFKDEESGFKGLHVDLVDVDGLVRKIETVRISKPGHRVYSDYKKLLKVKAGLGVLVVSTSRGMMGGEEARKKKLGGELICKAFFI
jgi:small subunit ribosomal protein S8